MMGITLHARQGGVKMFLIFNLLTVVFGAAAATQIFPPAHVQLCPIRQELVSVVRAYVVFYQDWQKKLEDILRTEEPKVGETPSDLYIYFSEQMEFSPTEVSDLIGHCEENILESCKLIQRIKALTLESLLLEMLENYGRTLANRKIMMDAHQLGSFKDQLVYANPKALDFFAASKQIGMLMLAFWTYQDVESKLTLLSTLWRAVPQKSEECMALFSTFECLQRYIKTGTMVDPDESSLRDGQRYLIMRTPYKLRVFKNTFKPDGTSQQKKQGHCFLDFQERGPICEALNCAYSKRDNMIIRIILGGKLTEDEIEELKTSNEELRRNIGLLCTISRHDKRGKEQVWEKLRKRYTPKPSAESVLPVFVEEEPSSQHRRLKKLRVRYPSTVVTEEPQCPSASAARAESPVRPKSEKVKTRPPGFLGDLSHILPDIDETLTTEETPAEESAAIIADGTNKQLELLEGVLGGTVTGCNVLDDLVPALERIGVQVINATGSSHWRIKYQTKVDTLWIPHRPCQAAHELVNKGYGSKFFGKMKSFLQECGFYLDEQERIRQHPITPSPQQLDCL